MSFIIVHLRKIYQVRLFAYIGELFGTGIIGALAAYPIAVYVMGKEAALFAYVLPFIISSASGNFFENL